MKFTFKQFHRQDSDDIWEDIPEKRPLTLIIFDLLLSYIPLTEDRKHSPDL